jgi:hypothetical protein
MSGPRGCGTTTAGLYWVADCVRDNPGASVVCCFNNTEAAEAAHSAFRKMFPFCKTTKMGLEFSNKTRIRLFTRFEALRGIEADSLWLDNTGVIPGSIPTEDLPAAKKILVTETRDYLANVVTSAKWPNSKLTITSPV